MAPAAVCIGEAVNKHGAIGVKDVDTGEVTICAAGDPGANYHTLCGTSLNDDCFEQVDVGDGARINCQMCKQTWELARSFRASDFTRR